MIFIVNGARNPNLLFWTTQTPVGMTRRAEATHLLPDPVQLTMEA